MNKFTKGKWRIAGGYEEITVSRIGILEGRKSICRQLENLFLPKEEWQANAKLIATAPELLEALERMVAHENDAHDTGACDNAIKIINKAKGIGWNDSE